MGLLYMSIHILQFYEFKYMNIENIQIQITWKNSCYLKMTHCVKAPNAAETPMKC